MRRTIRTCLTIIALGGFALTAACDKKEDAKADAGKKADANKKADDAAAKKAGDEKAAAEAGDEKAAAEAGDENAAAEAGDENAAEAAGGDALVIKASHLEPKPDDPVEVRLTGLKVVEAAFDPANLEGGSAKVEIDLTKLSTGSDQRDTHLQSADYLDVGQFATITVAVSDVKKADADYTATLVVDAHGKQVTWEAVPFKVTKTEGDAITVELTHKFKRTDFGVGRPPGGEEQVADDLEAALTMTIAKTG